MMWQLTQTAGSSERYEAPLAAEKVKPPVPARAPTSRLDRMVRRRAGCTFTSHSRKDICALGKQRARQSRWSGVLLRFFATSRRGRSAHDELKLTLLYRIQPDPTFMLNCVIGEDARSQAEFDVYALARPAFGWHTNATRSQRAPAIQFC